MLGNPDLAGGLSAPASADLGATIGSNSHSSRFVKLVLGGGLLLALLIVGLAFAPAWVLPRSLLLRMEGHHDDLVFGGIATALSIGFGLVIAFLLS